MTEGRELTPYKNEQKHEVDTYKKYEEIILLDKYKLMLHCDPLS